MIFHKELKELLDILEIEEEDILKKKGNMWGLAIYDMHRAEQYIDNLVNSARDEGSADSHCECEADIEEAHDEGREEVLQEVEVLCERSFAENLKEYLDENEIEMKDLTAEKLADFVKDFIRDRIY